MKKMLIACLVLVLLVALATFPLLRRPQQAPAGEEQVVVGFVELLSESAWRDAVARSIKQAAVEAGVQLLVENASRTQDSQTQAVRTLITYQVDAIVFSPVVMSGWDNVLREAQAAGISLILTERRVKTDVPDAVAAYVGADYEEQGREAARFIQRAFSGRQSPVRVMELLGTVGSSSTVDRSHGIRSVFGQEEAYDIFYSVSCDLMLSKAEETCRIFFTHGNLPDVLISYNDAMTYGAIKAMEALGIRPGEDVLIVSFDAEQRAVDLLIEGQISCEIETDPNVGGAIMEVVLALQSGGAANSRVLLPSRVFTGANTLAGIEPRGY